MIQIINKHLYVHILGRAVPVTAIADNDAEANKHMAASNDGVLLVQGRLIFMSDINDKGVKL